MFSITAPIVPYRHQIAGHGLATVHGILQTIIEVENDKRNIREKGIVIRESSNTVASCDSENSRNSGSAITSTLNEDTSTSIRAVCVLKPLSSSTKGQLERCFYEYIFNAALDQEQVTPDRRLLRQFLPQYYGHKQLSFSISSQNTLQLNNIHSQVDSIGADYIFLEDVMQRYRKPCILDIKIGQKTYDEFASVTKQQEETSKYIWQEQLGFRIVAMTMWFQKGRNINQTNSPSDLDLTLVEDRWSKDVGRSLSPEKVPSALQQFFQLPKTTSDAASNHTNIPAQIIVQEVLNNLKQMEIAFQVQRTFRLYASSLLIAYEGDPDRWANIDEPLSNRDIVTDTTKLDYFSDKIGVHMIDFGHACGPWLRQFPNLTAVLDKEMPSTESMNNNGTRPGERSNVTQGFQQGQDDNYLYGLQSLIHILQTI